MPLSAIRDYLLPKNPVTGNREIHLIPSFVEKFVGANSYAPLIEKSGGEIPSNHKNPKYRDYVRLVQEIGLTLACQAKRKNVEFEFKVIDSPKDNAWCLPGGKIGINVGLIEKMDAEKELFDLSQFSIQEKIAAVLSHEIIHADARHTGRSLEFRLFLIGIIKTAQLCTVHFFVNRSYNPKIEKANKEKDHSLATRLTQERDSKAKTIGFLFELASSWLINGLSLCNSRSNELESDKFGMRLIKDVSNTYSRSFTGNSPQAAIWLQHYFKKNHSHSHSNNFLKGLMNLFSTHPTSDERLKANIQTWADLQSGKL